MTRLQPNQRTSRVRECVIGVGACSIIVLGALRLTAATLQTPTPIGVSTTDPTGVFAKYCVTCHNGRLRTAGLALDQMDVRKISEQPQIWEKVLKKLRTGAMPPAGLPRPDTVIATESASWIERALDEAAAVRPNPGRSQSLHRLNRYEYRNAVRDLLELDIEVATLLPPDDASHGFDNIADGRISPTLLERYVTAARKISRLAIASSAIPEEVHTYVLDVDLSQNDRLGDLPFGTRGGILIQHQFPLDAEYLFRVFPAGNAYATGTAASKTGTPHQIEVSIDGERVQLLTVGRPDASASDRDQGLQVRVPIKAGLRSVGVTFLKRPSVEVEDLRQPFQRVFRLSTLLPSIDKIEIAGPYGGTGVNDTPTRRRIFVCRPASQRDEAGCARQVLSTVARRAYRRSPTEAELQDLLQFFAAGRAKQGFDSGVEMALRRVLVSPSFLFRVERDPAGMAPETAYRVSDVELASRLSFFLWSSFPDDELLGLAERGRLKEPGVLEGQVRRMLQDRRSQALVSNFAGQWLYLRNVAATKPDPRLFPDFDENLRQAMRRETELFFESILREERSLVELLTADYTFVNERLARHYGIPNIYGGHFRRVRLDGDRVRGGLLGQGSILTVTSYPIRTSPVQRGKWILENIIGAPPPPPPPDVPDLQATSGEGRVLSMRERMAQHRANATCASCHARMDPLGLALENFDAVGRWRTRSESNEPIDATGALPDGTKFEGPQGLREALTRDASQFVTTATEKLLTYALGRGLEYYDAPAVRKIIREAAPDHRLSALIVGIVKSVPFQMRRSAERAPAATVAAAR